MALSWGCLVALHIGSRSAGRKALPSPRGRDFAQAARAVVRAARQRCSGKVVSAREGGYHLEGSGRSPAAHVAALGED